MAGITKQRLKELVKEVMVEETEYQAFFQKALDKAGKSIPSMSDDEKKEFFNKIDSAWNGKGEKSESVVNEGQLNELGFLMTAAAAAVGIIGAGLLIKGVRFINQKLIDTAYSAAVQLQAKLAAKKAIQDKEQLEATIKPMVSKFENDSKLKQMYSELPEYNRYPVSKPAIEGNKKRKEMLKKISIYITSKLTDDEKKYVNDISKYLRGEKYVEESINEENPGLWANIRAKQARGEAPAPKNSKAYKDAVEAGDKIKNEQSIKREALKSIVKEVMQEEAEYQKFFQKVLDKAGKSIPSMSDDEKKAFFNKVDSAWSSRGEKNESTIKEGIWPKSKLSGQFQMQLSLQLKKHFKGVFYSVGYDLYHNDKKILTIDGDDDSINSVVAKLKSKIR